MSIKRLFDSQKKISKPTKKTTGDSLGSGLENFDHLEKVYKKKRRIIPSVDFLKPEEYIKFGSAEEYYKNAFEHISGYYPYDGSGEEKIDFELNLNLLEKHVFDNVYPKTTGYITLGRNYGTKAASSPDTGYHSASEDYISFFGGSAIGSLYDEELGRASNLDFGGPSGSTVEFWLKKDEHRSDRSSPNEVIFDVTNNQSGAAEARFRVELFSGSQDSFIVTCRSGSAGITTASLTIDNNTNITDNTWHHYAIAVGSGSSGLSFRVYKDGTCSSGEIITGSNIARCNGVFGRIGSLVASETVDLDGGTIASASYGKLSASLDEFRYWKGTRTSEEIGRFWFSEVNGATISSSLASDLGIYYKFNEGITGTTTTDQKILDYSGRVANGSWEGYDGESRFTGSAINDRDLGFSENPTPILYTSHEDYIALKDRYVTSGSQHDFSNYNSLMNSLPAWILEEDETTGNHLKQISQIMGSQLDTLHSQIGHMTKIKDVSYNSGSNSVFPYNEKLLESMGFSTPELFEDAELLSKVLNRSEDQIFEKDLNDIKNILFRNVYNNLTQIFKGKGTEKAFRNLLRCYGIDDNIYSLNAYSNNTKYKIEDRYTPAASTKRFLDFSGMRRNEDTSATVYQYYDNSNPESRGLITGTSQLEDYAFTIESSVLFPKKPDINDTRYYAISSVSSSLFGFHTPAEESPTSTVLTWAGSSDDYGLQVYAKRVIEGYQDFGDVATSKNVRFIVVNRAGTVLCTSSLCENVYNNNTWNIALSVRPTGYPFAKEYDNYTVELYGSQYDLGIKKSSFKTEATLSFDVGRATIASCKRLYAGAHRTNYNGGILNQSDVRLGNLRYWQTYLNQETLDFHARSIENFGTLHPNRNEYLFPSSASHHVPSVETLSLNWDFMNLTGSDDSGEFLLSDYSSGSNGDQLIKDKYQSNYSFSELDNIISRQHTGKGEFFKANDQPSRKEYVYTEKRQLLEQVVSSDMINILSEDDTAFTIDSRPVKYMFTVEKSMYDGISKRMLEFFGSIQEFSNLIGEPVNRYRQEYKDLAKLREIFFRRVGNEPDLDKFVDYYRWLDTAVSDAITQIFPISAGMPDASRVIVESHALERNKYAYKYQNLKSRRSVIEAAASGSVRYSWVFGHAPPALRAATATIVIADSGGIVNGETFTLVDSAGLSTVYTINGGVAQASGGGSGGTATVGFSGVGGGAAGKIAAASAMVTAINATTDANYTAVSDGVNTVTITQGTGGSGGNTTNSDSITSTTVSNFSGGATVPGSNQRERSAWWKHRANREKDVLLKGTEGVNVSAGTAQSRAMIHSASLSSFERQQRMVYQFSPMRVESPIGSRINRRRLFASNSDVYNQFTLDFKSDDNSELFIKRKYKFIANIDGETFEGRQVAPFSAHSSSVTNGYRQQLDAAGLTNIDITNLHEDSTGPDYEIPMQGPFTERHVGGLQFRHNQPATMDQKLRKEGFLLNASGGTLNLLDVHTPTATPLAWESIGDSVPQGKYYREELAKRPVNIRNIKSETNEDIAGSVRVLGNYVKNYEVVQTSGRDVNNLDLRKDPDKYKVNGSMSSFVMGLVDYAIPQRTTVRTVFTERFSAPGELATSTPAALDIETQQYSPNNALPFRNRSVRQPLQSLLSVNCGKYGFTGEIGDELLVSGSYTIEDLNAGSIGIPIASYHKTQRNSTHRLRINNNSDGPNSWLTGSQKDNEYVTRPIPAADRVSWFNRLIAGPATISNEHGRSSPGEQGSHEIYSLFVTSGSQLPENIDISALSTGSQLSASPIAINQTSSLPNPTVTFAGTSFIAEDFGYIAGSDAYIYYPWKNWHNYPIWKQTRVAQTRIAQNLIRSNTYRFYTTRQRVATSVVESPICSKHFPLITTVGTRESTVDDQGNRRPVTVSLIYSYGNEKETFNNQTLKDIFKSEIQKTKPYDTITKYRKEEFPKEISGIEKIIDHTYVEKIWPREENIYQAATRARQTFGQNYWKKSFTNAQTSSAGTIDTLNTSLSPVTHGFVSSSNFFKSTFNKSAPRVVNNRQNSQGFAPTFRSQFPFRGNGQEEYDSEIGFPQSLYEDGNYPLSGTYVTGGLTSIWPLDSFTCAPHMETTPSASNHSFHMVQSYGAGELMSIRYNAGFAFLRKATGATGSIYPSRPDGRDDASPGEIVALSGVLNPALLQFRVIKGGLGLDTGLIRENYPATCLYVYNVPTVERIWDQADRNPVFDQDAETSFLSQSIVYYDSPGGAYTRPAWSAGEKRKFVDGENRGQLSTPSTPFFDTYDKYTKIMHFLAKDYTVIPEFRLSEHVQDILENRQGNFHSFQDNLLSLTGSQIGMQDSSVTGFMKRYGLSDNHDYMSKFLREDFLVNKTPTDFGMKMEVAKQLLPYDGFYPVLRTLQIAELFSGSYGPVYSTTVSATSDLLRADSGNNNGSPSSAINATNTGELAQTAGWQNLLSAYFAPGILYNSIKSGIAVDTPARVYNKQFSHTESDTQWGSIFKTGSLGSEPRHPSPFEPLAGCLSGTLTSGSILPYRHYTDQELNAPGYYNGIEEGEGNNNEAQKVFWPYRLPFEALIEPERHIGEPRGREFCQGDVNYYLKAPGVTGTITAQPETRLYKMAMSNFLAAVPEFFLKDGKMTSFVAQPENPRNISVSADNVYTMEIVLEKTNNFNMYSNPYAFGPPTATGSSGWDGLLKPSENATAATCPEGDNWPLHRGEFAPFTPPYYYGTSIARLVYVPRETGQISLRDLIEQTSVSFINENSYKFDFDREPSDDYSEVGIPAYGWNRAWQNRMDIDASIIIDNVFPSGMGSTSTPSSRWTITPRWECPILDFPKGADSTLAAFSSSVESGNYRSLTHGMWHQYGIMPRDGQGIYLYLRDVTQDDTDRILSGSIPETGDDFKVGSVVRQSKLGNVGLERNVVSLNDLVNFQEYGEENKKRLGELAEEKIVKEAIIGLPYIINEEGQAEFIEIGFTGGDPDGEDAQSAFGPEMRKFREKFHQYNLPPSLERKLWQLSPTTYPKNYGEENRRDRFSAQYPGAEECIAMYLFEFSTRLTRQDLADIWQGVLPDISRRTELDVSAVDQALPLRGPNGQYDMVGVVERIDERLRDILHMSRAIDYGIQEHARRPNRKPGFEAEIKWMFFKVKYRGATNYYDMMFEQGFGKPMDIRIGGNAYRQREKTFNWPYDYFSMIELAKATSRTKFRPDTTRINQSGIDISED